MKQLLISLICSVTFAAGQDISCLQAGECQGGYYLQGVTINTAAQCQSLCDVTPGCRFITFYGEHLSKCFLFSSCPEILTDGCADCLAGPQTCDTETPECFEDGS